MKNISYNHSIVQNFPTEHSIEDLDMPKLNFQSENLRKLLTYHNKFIKCQ